MPAQTTSDLSSMADSGDIPNMLKMIFGVLDKVGTTEFWPEKKLKSILSSN